MFDVGKFFDMPENEWGRFNMKKIALENGLVIKYLYGSIRSTKERIRCFYSSLGNRKPKMGDILYSDCGRRVHIVEIGDEDIIFDLMD